MNVLLVGSNGMAGHMILSYLRSQGHHVRGLTRLDFDIENPQQVMSWFTDTDTSQFDFVINCAGVLVKDSIDKPDRAVLVNGWFPHYLERILQDSQTRLIHLSTDCVFDGSRGNYIETDTHTEMNAYGRSKSLGEVNNKKDITLRMSIIGPELKNGTGLLNWVLNCQDTQLPGWTNAWWNGITTLQLAKCIEMYMKNPCISGIYHVVNNKIRINKYGLLCHINEVYELDKVVVTTQSPKDVDKVLVDTRCEFDFNIPDYVKQLVELRDFDPLPHMRPAATRT